MSDIPPIAIEHRDEPMASEESGNNEATMEDESEMQISESSIFLNTLVLKKFDKLLSEMDLYVLRQLNPDYYGKLNLTYLDLVAKSIRVVKNFKPMAGGDEIFVQDPLLKSKIVSEWKTNFVIVSVTPTNEHYDYDNDGQKQNIKEITPQNWTPKIAHIFRQLELNEVWLSNDSKNGHPLLYKIINQVAPFVTSLKVNTLPQDPKKHGKTMSKFLKTFPNLKILTIDILSMLNGSSGGIYVMRGLTETLGQLEFGIANLKSNPKVHLNAKMIEMVQLFLDKFANKKNTTIHFKFFNSSLLEIIKNILMEFGNLKNIKYSFKLQKGFQNLADLETFTGFFSQLKNQIEYLHLTLPFDVDDNNFEDVDEVGIRKCLAKLSPFVNVLAIWLYSKDWNILPHKSNWPKLTKLWIVGSHYPLEILKNCSNLEILVLFMDTMDECLFSNPQKSDKESLDEYFGNLPRLRKLTFMSRLKPTGKFMPGSELDEYLKSILPKLQTIEYDYDEFSPRQ